MSVVLNNLRIALQAQPSLQSQDLQLLCTLVSPSGFTAELEDWTLEQFLGLALHLLITTESEATHRVLATLLPKFGGQAVRPLVRIAQSSQVPEDLRSLGLSILGSFTPGALATGLVSVLDTEDPRTLQPAVLQVVMMLGEPVTQALKSLLPELTWQRLMLHRLSFSSPEQGMPEPAISRPTGTEKTTYSAHSVAVA
jgi:hypothetical protein